MTRSSASSMLMLSAALVTGCGSKDDAVCSNVHAIDARLLDAQAAAKTSYEPPVISACPELDPPLDGEDKSLGLTAREYAALLRGANGNFFDDHVWWLKATPRGESHVIPVQITAERCDQVTFAKFGYDYAFATPPLPSAPACGRYLTGVHVGHQMGDSWPEIFSIEGSGVIRLAPLASTTAFAAFLRLPRDPLDVPAPDSTVDRVDVVRHDGDSLEFAALANGPTFASSLRLVLKVGDESRLSVQLELEPRALATENPLVAVGALSAWFSNDANRDFDRVRATFSDGTSFETALSEPGLDWGKGQWTSVALPQGGAPLESLEFLQNGRRDGIPRPNVTISNFQSSVPIGLDLSLSTRSVLGGNVVANLLVDSSASSQSDGPISVSYLVTASPP